MAEKQLLIEACDFSFNCNMTENVKNTLTESLHIKEGKHNTLYVSNIPCCILDYLNQNQRIYPTEIMQKAIAEAKYKMDRNMLRCSGNEHPTASEVNIGEVSHVIKKAYIKNVEIEVDGKKERHNVLFCDFLVLPTKPWGENMIIYLMNNIAIGLSIRGLGSCDSKNRVVEYEFCGVDAVANPSSKTYSNMSIKESVSEAKIKNLSKSLNETFVVSASATNVVRDLDQALVLANDIENAEFGTVKKTSTKLDSEVDPKTGAETTMVTLETETEDEVSDIDQALAMAKQAMLNGRADIDSVTIENVKEEQPKESVENSDAPLNEDDIEPEVKVNEEYVPESAIAEGKDTEFTTGNEPEGDIADKLMYDIRQLMYNEGLSLEQACRKYCEQHENIPYEYVLEYMKPAIAANESITEAADSERANRCHNIAEILHNIIYGNYTSKEEKDLAKQYRDNYVKAIHNLDISNEELDPYLKKLESDVYDTFINPAVKKFKKVIGEAKEEEKDPTEGQKYVLKTNQGFVAMDGNAIKFVEKPHDAIHFVKGKEESGVIHLSGINKILDTMGIYDVEKYYKKGTTDISAKDDVNIQVANTTEEKPVKECGNNTPMTEDNGSNTRYSAHVSIMTDSGTTEEDIPVSAVEMEGINKEVANLYDMKAQKGQPQITVTDTTTGEQLMFNPETHMVEPVEIQQESVGELEQDGNKLSMQIDDKNTVEKEFENPAQASVVKAGIEKGKLGGDVLIPESADDDEEESEMVKCAWCGEEAEKSAMKKEKDLGWLCNTCARGIASREGPLNFEEANDRPHYEDVKPGWYAGAEGVGVTGPYESKEALLADLGDVADKIDIEYISAEDLGVAAEATKIDEVMFNEPGEASDPEIKKPMNDAVEQDVMVSVNNIDWNTDDLINTFMNNMQPDDPVSFGDIESKINDLPNHIDIKMSKEELPEDVTLDSLKELVKEKIAKTYAMNVNDLAITELNSIN